MLAAFVGDAVDENFKETVCKLLEKYVKALSVSEKEIYFSGFDKCEIICAFGRGLKEIIADDAVVFLNNCLSPIRISNERYCVLDSLNQNDLTLAQKSRGEVITCGLSTRDTLTFSSCTEENCVISLQRQIRRFNGSIAEPFELPINCEKHDDRYAILCASLLLILLGII